MKIIRRYGIAVFVASLIVAGQFLVVEAAAKKRGGAAGKPRL